MTCASAGAHSTHDICRLAQHVPLLAALDRSAPGQVRAAAHLRGSCLGTLRVLKQERASAGAHSLAVLLGVVWGVHHLEAVVLLQHGRVVADALNEQILPAPMEAIPLRQGVPGLASSICLYVPAEHRRAGQVLAREPFQEGLGLLASTSKHACLQECGPKPKGCHVGCESSCAIAPAGTAAPRWSWLRRRWPLERPLHTNKHVLNGTITATCGSGCHSAQHFKRTSNTMDCIGCCAMHAEKQP